MRRRHLLLLLVVAGLLAAVPVQADEAPPPVEVHGWSLTRYYVDQAVNATRSADGTISNVQRKSGLEPFERISLSAIARLPENRVAYAEVYIHDWLPHTDPSYFYLESLYLDVPQAPGTKIRFGKGRDYTFGITPAYPARKTSNYSPVAEAFTQDRVLGMQVMSTQGPNTVNFGLFNAERVGERFTGMAADAQLDNGVGALLNTTVGHLANRDVPDNRSGEVQGSVRLARQLSPALNVGLSGRVSGLDATDRGFLAKHFTGRTIASSREQYGLDATYSQAPLFASLEAYGGNTGGVRQTGWQVVGGLEPTAESRFRAFCKGVYVRYGELNVGATPTLDTLTWDTRQLAVSYVFPFEFRGPLSAKWLQFEYERNQESPPAGVSQIPNNVFFIELFSAF